MNLTATSLRPPQVIVSVRRTCAHWGTFDTVIAAHALSPRLTLITYIAFLFDENGKWIGSNKVWIHISQGPGDNEFTAATKSSRRDLQDNEISTAQGRLAGKRIQVAVLTSRFTASRWVR